MSIPFYLSVGGLEPDCNGIVWSGQTTINETPVRIDFKEDKNMNMTEIKRVKAKDFDSEAFRRNEFRIVIRSPKSVSKTLQFLHNEGYTWGNTKTSLVDDDRMNELLLDGVQRHPEFIIAYGKMTNGILRDFMALSVRPTIEIDFREHPSNDKIVITNDGKITTATLYSNGKKAGIGTAVCHYDDKFDVYAGARLALERLEKYKKEPEMTDWEKFVNNKVNMRVPKKYIQNFLDRAEKDGLTFKGTMSDWYLRWLMQNGDNIVVSVNNKIDKTPILTEVLCDDNGKTVDYIPGMK